MNLLFIPLLPLISFGVLILLGRRLGKLSPVVSLAALAGSFFLSIARCSELVASRSEHHFTWAWGPSGARSFHLGLLFDPLSAVMCLVVAGIGLLIMLYSIGYMSQDPRFSRFFAYLSLFFSAMLLLVLADHFILLYIGWELVGLCSYLLISFWFERPAAAQAGRKAFLTTRVGDLGLLAAILIIATWSGDLSLSSLEVKAVALGAWAPIVAILLFIGASGKSAQFPLHVWLPDAMEGPTPVSALIHAATMVAAGVYLLARTFPLFMASPQALSVVMGIAGITSFFAATIACTQTDLKKILAYSTISQLGLMMLGLGWGSVSAGMFHLVTHAWFKALLFLGAGSVIHAVHHQEITRMGGLFRSMPVTALTFTIGGVAMAGVPPLAGFWSKEELLSAASHHGLPMVILFLSISGLTAFYITRAVLLTFFGRPRESTREPGGASGAASDSGSRTHESPWVMTIPLIVLAFGAASVGILGSPWAGHRFQNFLNPHTAREAHVGASLLIASIAVAAFGILLAGFRYGLSMQILPASLRARLRPLYRLAANKYYVDEIYERFLIEPILRFSRGAQGFDAHTIDAAVNETGVAGLRLSAFKGWVDKVLVDGLVNGIGISVSKVGAALRRLQTGLVQNYLLLAVGLTVTIFLILQWKP